MHAVTLPPAEPQAETGAVTPLNSPSLIRGSDGSAATNGITTARTPPTSPPNDPVTWGESATFLKRYDDNIV